MCHWRAKDPRIERARTLSPGFQFLSRVVEVVIARAKEKVV